MTPAGGAAAAVAAVAGAVVDEGRLLVGAVTGC